MASYENAVEAVVVEWLQASTGLTAANIYPRSRLNTISFPCAIVSAVDTGEDQACRIGSSYVRNLDLTVRWYVAPEATDATTLDGLVSATNTALTTTPDPLPDGLDDFDFFEIDPKSTSDLEVDNGQLYRQTSYAILAHLSED